MPCSGRLWRGKVRLVRAVGRRGFSLCPAGVWCGRPRFTAGVESGRQSWRHGPSRRLLTLAATDRLRRTPAGVGFRQVAGRAHTALERTVSVTGGVPSAPAAAGCRHVPPLPAVRGAPVCGSLGRAAGLCAARGLSRHRGDPSADAGRDSVTGGRLSVTAVSATCRRPLRPGTCARVGSERCLSAIAAGFLLPRLPPASVPFRFSQISGHSGLHASQ